MKQKILVFILVLALMASFVPYAGATEGEVPGSLETAVLEKVEVLNDPSGMPYFRLEVKLPQSFLNLNEERPADGSPWIDYYWKIDDGAGNISGGGTADCLIDESYGCAVEGKENTFRISDIYPEDEGGSKEIVIKDHIYTIKIKLAYAYRVEEGPVTFVESSFSNELSIGSGSFYAKASDWAKSELQEADELGLIPDILIGVDMTQPITREEFCELAVLLYEKVTGEPGKPVSPNPFTDTSKAQILKAFKLGITTGTSATTFSPDALINREQCATMLFRAIKAMKPNEDYSVSGVGDFPDQKEISSWAAEAAKYMFRIGIISGDTSGNFMPKATTTTQEAAGYGTATREQAIAMSLRTFEKI